ncbi:hypothetical protein [Pseudomonas citronellolis]|uniref:hypothetical protein n=1 Tax=Pseudomonas citronellolis TaxID=53408 RepID=UPI002D799008|nr:hypothetical protein [Pseudomonas citronellolis]WRT83517.1 hypothetical protein VK748_03565 [Pseudomonas citronellolis]
MPELKPVSSLDVCELLRHYRRDLSMRSFPCNDEGDWNLRWTRKEIERVDRAFSTLQQAELSIPADQMLVPRELLERVEESLRSEIEERYAATKDHPAIQPKYLRDIAEVDELRALLQS